MTPENIILNLCIQTANRLHREITTQANLGFVSNAKLATLWRHFETDMMLQHRRDGMIWMIFGTLTGDHSKLVYTART